MDEMQKLRLALNELLSEYGVDRAGIDAAFDLATEHGEAEYEKGYDYAVVSNHIPTD